MRDDLLALPRKEELTSFMAESWRERIVSARRLSYAPPLARRHVHRYVGKLKTRCPTEKGNDSCRGLIGIESAENTPEFRGVR